MALAMFLAVPLGAVGPVLASDRAISKEYQVKAVFLFNFAQFVQWPAKSFDDAQEPFQIGVLGEDPFDGFLDDTVKGEKVGRHPLVVHRYARATDIHKCQILFICRSEDPKMADILSSLKGKGILTVGDTDHFIKDGGMVRFFNDRNKVHLKINPSAAKRDHLTISSQVLRLAELAKPGEE